MSPSISAFGVNAATETATSTLSGLTNTFEIGTNIEASLGFTNNLDGKIFDWKYYPNFVLSATNAQEHFDYLYQVDPTVPSLPTIIYAYTDTKQLDFGTTIWYDFNADSLDKVGSQDGTLISGNETFDGEAITTESSTEFQGVTAPNQSIVGNVGVTIELVYQVTTADKLNYLCVCCCFVIYIPNQDAKI